MNHNQEMATMVIQTERKDNDVCTFKPIQVRFRHHHLILMTMELSEASIVLEVKPG